MLDTRERLLGDYVAIPRKLLDALVHMYKDSVSRGTRALVGVAKQFDEHLSRSRRCSQVRAEVRRRRRDLLRQYVEVGIKDPRKVLDLLRKDAPELAKVRLKTIKNMLAEL
jgi:hypothetical protein